jgi:hypothetical protein
MEKDWWKTFGSVQEVRNLFCLHEVGTKCMRTGAVNSSKTDLSSLGKGVHWCSKMMNYIMESSEGCGNRSRRRTFRNSTPWPGIPSCKLNKSQLRAQCSKVRMPWTKLHTDSITEVPTNSTWSIYLFFQILVVRRREDRALLFRPNYPQTDMEYTPLVKCSHILDHSTHKLTWSRNLYVKVPNSKFWPGYPQSDMK